MAGETASTLAEQSLRDGDPRRALALLQEQVRKNPADPKSRVFLFQLLSILGQWERAHNQLNVIGELDAGALPMVKIYGDALRCEALRAKVFAGERQPTIFGRPEPWVALLIEALRLTASGAAAQSQAVREQAFEQAPATSGTLNGQPFAWIADADPRLGPVLEVIFNTQYYWVPYQRIRSLAIDEAADLRDLVWATARLTLSNGGEVIGLVPARYPGSEASDDAAIQLGRRTEWVDRGAEVFVGLGQRMLATDTGEFALLDVRAVLLDTEDEPSAGPAADGAPAEGAPAEGASPGG